MTTFGVKYPYQKENLHKGVTFKNYLHKGVYFVNIYAGGHFLHGTRQR